MSFYKWTKWHAKEEDGGLLPLSSLSPPRRDSVLVREGLVGPALWGPSPAILCSESLAHCFLPPARPSTRVGVLGAGGTQPGRKRTLPSNQTPATLCPSPLPNISSCSLPSSFYLPPSLSLYPSLLPSLLPSLPPSSPKGMRFKFVDCC